MRIRTLLTLSYVAVAAGLIGFLTGCVSEPSPMISDLASADAAVRARAEDQIMDGGVESLETIDASIDQPETPVEAKGQALLLAGKIGAENTAAVSECVDIMAKGLRVAPLRKYATAGLYKLGKPAVPYLTESMMEEDNTESLRGMATAARLIGDKSVINKLVAYLREKVEAAQKNSLSSYEEAKVVRVTTALDYLTDKGLPPAKREGASAVDAKIIKQWIQWWEEDKGTFVFPVR